MISPTIQTGSIDSGATVQFHPYHLVDNSPWPLAVSLSLINFALSIVLFFNKIVLITTINSSTPLLVALLSISLLIFSWLKDINSEGAYLGCHTQVVKRGLTVGFLLFVLTEIMFFVSIFWAFLHISLSPAIELGTSWPPLGLVAINPWGLPLLNTILLLSSGALLTIAHHFFINGNRGVAIIGFTFTVALSLIFTACQLIEFSTAPFTIADSAFATAFYFGTTFHGIHVILGTVILAVAGLRLKNYQFTSGHHVGIESAIVYWHIVDVVWLFLFVVVYWWSY